MPNEDGRFTRKLYAENPGANDPPGGAGRKEPTFFATDAHRLTQISRRNACFYRCPSVSICGKNLTAKRQLLTDERLLPLKHRYPFFLKRRHAFAIIVRKSAFTHQLAFERQLLVEGVVRAGVDRLFGTRET